MGARNTQGSSGTAGPQATVHAHRAQVEVHLAAADELHDDVWKLVVGLAKLRHLGGKGGV